MGICLLLFAVFIYRTIFTANPYVRKEYIFMAQQLTSDVAVKLKQRHNMVVVGVTAGLADAVNILGLEFQIRGPLSKEKLRSILVDCVEEFLISVNTNEQLRPFLKNYPFTEKEVEIVLYVLDATGRNVYHPEILVAVASHGIIWYATKDKNVKFGYKQDIEESYQTAFKIVQESKNTQEPE